MLCYRCSALQCIAVEQMYVYSSVAAVQRSIFESKNGPGVDEQLSAVYKSMKVLYYKSMKSDQWRKEGGAQV